MFACLLIAFVAVLSLTVSSCPVRCDTPTQDCADHTPSLTPTRSPAPTRPAKPSPVVADASNGPFTDGVATYFYQGGNPGACGWYNSDSAFICAMDQTRFGNSGPGSPLCGQQVQITNSNNGQTITVTIVDDCPTCMNENSIDLSVGAFQALSDLSIGEIPISWSYV